MDMFPFRGRASALDDRSRRFLTTVASLGGHLSAEQAHQAHCTGGLLAEHPLAQLPAHRERLGQGSGSEAGGCENSASARRHRDHLDRLRRLGMDAKRRIQQRLVAFVNEQANAADAAKEASRIERAWGARMPESVQ